MKTNEPVYINGYEAEERDGWYHWEEVDEHTGYPVYRSVPVSAMPTEPDEEEIMSVEIYYAWKKPFVGDDGNTRLITPRADPMVYEEPYDYIFSDIEEAIKFLKEDTFAWGDAREEGWQLVKVTQESLPLFATELLEGVEDED